MSDEQWDQIGGLFSKYRTGVDNRTAFNAILWIARSGAAWRDLSESDMELGKLSTPAFVIGGIVVN